MARLAYPHPLPAVSEVDWRALVEETLNGTPFEALTARTEDAIPLGPIYGQQVNEAPIATRPGGRRWRIVERIDHPDPQEASRQALAAAEGGADAVEFVFDASPNARGRGIPGKGWPDLLHGLPLDTLAIRIDAGEESAAIAGRAVKAVTSLATIFDPVATLAASGALRAPLAAHYTGPVGVTADMRPYHAAGASGADELGIALATLIAHLRELEATGRKPAHALASIEAVLVADGDELLTIAKLRAFRLLHARLAEAVGAPAASVRLHVETAWRMLGRRDPHSNMLRSGLAAFAAAIGGADSLTVLPYDARLAASDGFAQRQARNAQILLADEAQLHCVGDPAAGSGAFAALTEALAAAGWTTMQAIESEGGLVTSLRNGGLQSRLAERSSARAGRISSGGLRLVGVNIARTASPVPISPSAQRPVPRVDSVAEQVAALVAAPFEAVGPEETGS